MFERHNRNAKMKKNPRGEHVQEIMYFYMFLQGFAPEPKQTVSAGTRPPIEDSTAQAHLMAVHPYSNQSHARGVQEGVPSSKTGPLPHHPMGGGVVGEWGGGE